jgi:tetratricopeptide (TPR) repeat protein
MGVRGVLAAGILLAFAGCGRPDPLAAAGVACVDPASEVEATIDACTRLIEWPNSPDSERSIALAHRGAALQAGGDVTSGLRDFEAALALDAGNMMAVMGRASVLIESGQVDAAEPLAQKLIASGQYEDQAHFLRGRIAAQRGDTAEALAAYDSAIAANRRFAEAFSGRGQVKQGLADYPRRSRGDAGVGSCRARATLIARARMRTPPPPPPPLIPAMSKPSFVAVSCNCARASGTRRAIPTMRRSQ